jgi:cell division protein FtsQ
MRAVKIWVIVSLLIGSVWLVAHKFKDFGSGAVPVKYVRTEGVFQYLSKDDVKAVLEPLVNTGFFSADMQAIHQAVATLPWVESLSVKRVWPDTIDIKVFEKKPYVRWRENSLITDDGVVFTPKNVDQFSNLPMVSGPDLQQKKVLERMKGVQTVLADQSLELSEFSMDDRLAWKIKLAGGMELLLGRNEPLMKLQRFLKTLPILKQEQVDAMAVVDLRYPNGYAVSWKPDSGCCQWNTTTAP